MFFSGFFGIPLFYRKLYECGSLMLFLALLQQGRRVQEVQPGVYHQYSEYEAYADIILDLLIIVLAILFAATANRMAGRKYLRRGWEFAEPHSEIAQTARRKWGIDAPPKTEPLRLSVDSEPPSMDKGTPIPLPPRRYPAWIWLMGVGLVVVVVASIALLQPEQHSIPGDQNKGATEVNLTQEGDTFLVPVRINGQITLNFTLDSGASDVQIPVDVFLTLYRTGIVTTQDFLGSEAYVLADGTTVPSDRFLLHSVQVRDYPVYDVTASIGSVRSTPLLGQSFLSKLGAWTLDNKRHVLVFSDKQ